MEVVGRVVMDREKVLAVDKFERESKQVRLVNPAIGIVEPYHMCHQWLT